VIDRRQLLTLGAAICVPSIARAQSTPAERLVVDLIAAYNSADTAVTAGFVSARMGQDMAARFGGPEGWALLLLDKYAAYGPMTLERIDPAGANGVRAWARGSISRAWLGVVLSGADRIDEVTFLEGLPPPFAARAPRGPVPSPRTLAAGLADRVSALAAGGHFSGSVQMSVGSDVLLHRAWGFSDEARRSPNGAATRYDIASVGKVFTAVAIGQLVDAGKVDLDVPISRWLPELPAVVAGQVTPRRLLTHTSGVELDDVPEFREAMRSANSVSDMVGVQARFMDRLPGGADFAPPSDRDFNYSNEDFVLLGAIVERAGRSDYWTYLDRNIAAPAGFGSRFTDQSPRDAATATRLEFAGPGQAGERFHRRAARDFERPSPAGGAYLSARDLHRFARSLLEGRLMSGASVAEWTRAQVATLPGRGYGYGFEVIDTPLRCFGHRGGTRGASARLDIYPDLDVVLAVLSNYDTAANVVADGFAGMLAGAP
jgi:CubicO group peptidase (beta-lactamase class C family)